jgi:glycine/D-amino acid oxidase-like deaminating enzyme/nitrite reductase/ring-hydroxylating ferredoxin subunit
MDRSSGDTGADRQDPGSRVLWSRDIGSRPRPPLTERRAADVVIVGAGLVGLATALHLALAGQSVVVLEARAVGAGTTGGTTGKLSLLQGTRLSRIAGKHPQEVVAQYVEANRAGFDWLQTYCAEREVELARRDAVTFARRAESVPDLETELLACERSGVPARWDRLDELPFRHYGGVLLPDQAQLDPAALLDALVRDLEMLGVDIHEGTRVRSVRRSGHGVLVVTSQGVVRCGRAVLATGLPIGRRGGFFARLEPLRSYLNAYEVDGPLPRGMYISADEPTRSLRTATDPVTGAERLLVGGEGHVVGREPHPLGRVDALDTWAAEAFPGARRTHRWSAQDYRPTADLPFVGALTPRDGRVLVATGFDKWGLTNGAAAAITLSSTILGEEPSWAGAMAPWSARERPGFRRGLLINAAVAGRMSSDWWRTLTESRPTGPRSAPGTVSQGTRPVAQCTEDGVRRVVSAVCPHLGGVVAWNDAERSWDCPLHGSRFAPDGALLEGPSTRGLRRLEERRHRA